MSAPEHTTTPLSTERWLGNRIRRLIERDRGRDDARELPAGWSGPPTIRAADVEELTASWDIRFVMMHSGRPRLAPVVMRIRQFLQTALFPLLVRLSEFNAASVRVIATLAEHASEVDARHAELAERVERLEQTMRPTGGAPFESDAQTGELGRRVVDAASSVPGPVVVLGDVGEVAELLRATGRDVQLVDEDPAAALEKTDRQGIAVVVFAGALERLAPTDAARLLEIAADRLLPGGVLAVEAVNPRSARALLAVSSMPGTMHPYDPDALEELLGLLGYVDVRVDIAAPPSGRYAIVARRGPAS